MKQWDSFSFVLFTGERKCCVFATFEKSDLNYCNIARVFSGKIQFYCLLRK
jgi:hypothetical protein